VDKSVVTVRTGYLFLPLVPPRRSSGVPYPRFIRQLRERALADQK